MPIYDYNGGMLKVTTNKENKMTYTNENELFDAFYNDADILGESYIGEVEYGVVADEDGNAIFVNSVGIITGFQISGMSVVGTYEK
jgi:hypothetical protein